MSRSLLILATAVYSLSGPALIQTNDSPAPVELDVVVADRQGNPVSGLRAEDFSVTEDGGHVTVDECREVSASNAEGGSGGRSIVLLLDDLLVPAIGTTIVQQIARLFLGRVQRDDTVSVVRLGHQEDDALAPQLVAPIRIEEYTPASVAPSDDEIKTSTLKAITRIASEIDSEPRRRTAVICIGASIVCNPYVPRPRRSSVWQPWRLAIRSAGRTNIAVYFVDPAGLYSGPDYGDGLADQTGGKAFVRSGDFLHAATTVWNEISHYYLVRYTPLSRRGPLHSVRVAVGRRGVHVRARGFRVE